MVGQEILLSVCVPNYNQGKALLLSVENLKHLLCYPEIEIIISDNGSTETASIEALKLARIRLPGVKIFTGAAKLRTSEDWFFGFGSNLDRMVNNSSGEYVWILGSGDLIYVDFIPQILRQLKNGLFDNFNLNADQYKSSEIDDIRDLNLIVDADLRTNLDLKTISHPVFDHSVSCNITRKIVYEYSYQEEFNFQDSWPHVEKYLNYIGTTSTFLACKVETPVLIVDQPGDGWFTKSIAIDVFLLLGILYQSYEQNKGKISRHLRKQLFKNRILEVVSLVIHLRIKSSSNSSVTRQYVATIANSLPVRKKVYFLISIYSPMSFLKFFRYFNSLFIKL